MWQHLTALSLASLLLGAQGKHVLHEVRTTAIHKAWQRVSRVAPEAIVPVRIGLKQNNLELGGDRLMAISHPESEHYGKHMSESEVHDLFAPSADTVDAVREWLVEEGIDEKLIAHSDNKGWLALNIPAESAESLFLSELHEYEHARTGQIRVGCDEYHIPAKLREHIDYVTPGIMMSATLKKREVKRDDTWKKGHSKSPQAHPNGAASNNGWTLPPPAYSLPEELQNCGVNVRILTSLPWVTNFHMGPILTGGVDHPSVLESTLWTPCWFHQRQRQ